ncbi:hypothetical protein Cyrtocomes_00139 [Candidatus Cyrtobacter comes]|uniref:Uncharacterized protein n=1 Tax=Candidatus Cyrtobacter comes TaxID=675776 RepID=A0ABU5L6M9_9RICK|nr:hypothetical protein [Candidatus Cyrtobacter comes]MDZ5761781.1 hypothetical protein [Candidatus Cyrtobacter comes]
MPHLIMPYTIQDNKLPHSINVLDLLKTRMMNYCTPKSILKFIHAKFYDRAFADLAKHIHGEDFITPKFRDKILASKLLETLDDNLVDQIKSLPGIITLVQLAEKHSLNPFCDSVIKATLNHCAAVCISAIFTPIFSGNSSLKDGIILLPYHILAKGIADQAWSILEPFVLDSWDRLQKHELQHDAQELQHNTPELHQQSVEAIL